MDKSFFHIYIKTNNYHDKYDALNGNPNLNEHLREEEVNEKKKEFHIIGSKE